MIRFTFKEVTHGSAQYEQTVQLRQELLRRPLGLVFTEEDLKKEQDHIHLSLWKNEDELLACLVMVPQDNNTWKMRQVAVRHDWQRKHIGQKLIIDSEHFAREKGIACIYLHAREPVISFYQKLGYKAVGELFEEIGIPHQRMEKELKRRQTV